MAGIIAVYSLVIAVLIAGDMNPPPQQNYVLYKSVPLFSQGTKKGLTHMQWFLASCGRTVGWSHWASGRIYDWDRGRFSESFPCTITRKKLTKDRRASEHTCSSREYLWAWF